jgi:hypothetical protein
MDEEEDDICWTGLGFGGIGGALWGSEYGPLIIG